MSRLFLICLCLLSAAPVQAQTFADRLAAAEQATASLNAKLDSIAAQLDRLGKPPTLELVPPVVKVTPCCCACGCADTGLCTCGDPKQLSQRDHLTTAQADALCARGFTCYSYDDGQTWTTTRRVGYGDAKPTAPVSLWRGNVTPLFHGNCGLRG